MSFEDLGLNGEILKAIHEAGYSEPTPIQAKAIPAILMGQDVLGCAQTGTGKTASFTLPMIEILSSGRARARMPRSLVLTPTRELAAQVAQNFDTYGKYLRLSKALLVGGVSMGEQIKALDQGVDVLIATPGRLLDLFERGNILLSDIKILVIDECDRMLDMGFIPDIEKIVSLLPPRRQNLLFSATVPPEIRGLVDRFLVSPKEIAVVAQAAAAKTVTQGLLILESHLKISSLLELIKGEDVKNAFIFCNRKRDIAGVLRSLQKVGYSAGALHGDMNQSQRTLTLKRFKDNELNFLVCSDVVARGIDISGLSHVFNVDVPINAEDYIHRIGRTGRAGREGRAFTLASNDDEKYVLAIEKLIGHSIPRISIKTASSDDVIETRNQDHSPPSRPPSGPVSSAVDSPANRPQRNDVRAPERRPERVESVRSTSRTGQRWPDEPQDNVLGFGDDAPPFFQNGA